MQRVGTVGRCPTIRGGLAAIFALTSLGLLASCNSATVGESVDASQVDVTDKVRSLDLLPRQPQPVSGLAAAGGSQGGAVRAAMYEGSEVTGVADARPQPASNGNGFDLNFESTPVATVAKVVLGDILHVGYTIDPRVQGTVSLVSVRPVPKSDMVFVLENALRLSGVVLLKDTAGYRLTPLGDAVGGGRVDAAAANPEPGFGISVVPLQYVSAQTLLKLTDSFATRAGSIRADTTRNLLLIQGTGAERRTAVDTVLSFDVDWMRGQSVGIFPISSGSPAPVIAELEKIVDSGENGLSQNVIKFMPIARLNAVLVVTKKPDMLHTAATWIKRLDRNDTARTSVHVYRVKYGDARQIARVLTDMFLGGSSGNLLDSADSQLAPGSGTSSTSSVADRLSANSNSGANSGSFASRGTSGTGATGQGLGQGFGAGGQANNPNQGQGNNAALDSGRGANSGSGNGQPVMQDVRITPDVVNNNLLIYADQANYRIIEATLQQIDEPQLQVAIDATIAEVTLNNTLSYGVQTYLTSRNLGLKPNVGSFTGTQATTAPATTTDATTGVASVAGSVTNAFINRAFPGFNFLIGSETQPSLILDALHAVTSVKVLSNPSLVVINNQVATLQVGDVVPVSTGSATVLTGSNTVVNTIDYRNTGIILRVSPRVSVNGTVRLDVEQEISNVPQTSANSLTPTVSERRVKSQIAVANGQTVLLAGLISEQQSGSRNALPVLDQIPGLGDAFGHQSNGTQRTELIIFIRPQIIRNGSDAQMVAEELRSKLRGNIATTSTNAPITTAYH
ncbi:MULTISPECIES: type II secretion system secretin GspD [unclassified Bradyrhizobium]|uniref:type II secretion system secretin GspD n=1 Tax=unclassified Bradyrhizobium TaxID=2631580 RepID=UPI001BA487FB|nr:MULTISPECIES: type II secretion system secretin GspD [unclassified Bradyrhizobium]MBR1207595.1 type II secretion system secretin GspD [Bradyrhizobium sp. AUGA SZCCT0124]MBR1316011.1 type II secretion system secretin GspD [Bradyrhizobium sp. AUGA SZCCT0051]MBR1344117.1 type II secretion system secretin GspD [Bradyrhizobium sp. AUGA SZCCT0105]MBR1357896.1 type II secretion system secretin GspD [Bradyrhizobium sp. AUGA SZCCT0045]